MGLHLPNGSTIRRFDALMLHVYSHELRVCKGHKMLLILREISKPAPSAGQKDLFPAASIPPESSLEVFSVKHEQERKQSRSRFYFLIGCIRQESNN